MNVLKFNGGRQKTVEWFPKDVYDIVTICGIIEKRMKRGHLYEIKGENQFWFFVGRM